MKKFIAGFVMAAAAAPAAQAGGWSGPMDEMRTMEANEQGPVVRVKHQYTQVVCCSCRISVAYRPHPCNRYRHPAHPMQRTAHQLVRRTVAQPAPARPDYNRTQRVVSEKIYVQKVHRYPSATCPLR